LHCLFLSDEHNPALDSSPRLWPCVLKMTGIYSFQRTGVLCYNKFSYDRPTFRISLTRGASESMTGKIILTSVLTLLLAGISSGAEFNYTWKDTEGNLFITDYPPPDGAEILEVSIIPLPEQKQVAPARKQEVTPGQKATLSRLEAEAAVLRKQEADLRQKAAELVAEADEQLRLAKKRHYKERYQRRAGIKKREAEELARQADALSVKAESLERQASGRK
jgi:hypothetical protein